MEIQEIKEKAKILLQQYKDFDDYCNNIKTDCVDIEELYNNTELFLQDILK